MTLGNDQQQLHIKTLKKIIKAFKSFLLGYFFSEVEGLDVVISYMPKEFVWDLRDFLKEIFCNVI